MIKTILCDFSRVILFPKDGSYLGKLNPLHNELRQKNEGSFQDYFSFNDELLNYFSKLKGKISLYIFTTGSVQEAQARIKPIFGQILTVREYNISKEDPQAYIFITKKLGIKPEETLFIDDKKENIDAAKEAGLLVIHYKDNLTLFDSLNNPEVST